MGQLTPAVHNALTLKKATGLAVLFFVFVLSGCAVAPTVQKPPAMTINVPASPEKTKTILEKIQSTHPDYTIRALLQPEETGTTVNLAVYTLRNIHMVVGGFHEPDPHKNIYPDCNHCFNLTRNFDPACGGGPYLGTANLVFADGIGLGLLFDLFQTGRYPFAYTKVPVPDNTATDVVLGELRSSAKATLIPSSKNIRISER